MAGSSTGTGVAVAARLAVIGLGTDTRASVTAPAGHAHLYGLRPPLGSVDMTGVFPLYGEEFDIVGPMALKAKDLTTLYEAMKNNSNQTEENSSRQIRIGLLPTLLYGNFTANIGNILFLTYAVDDEVQNRFMLLESQLESLKDMYNMSIVKLYPDVVPYYENLLHDHSGLACALDYMNDFLGKHPMRSSNGSLITDMLQVQDEPGMLNFYVAVLKAQQAKLGNCSLAKAAYFTKVARMQQRIREEIFNENIDIIIRPETNVLSTIYPNLKLLYGPTSFDTDTDNVTFAPYPRRSGDPVPYFCSVVTFPVLNVPLGLSEPRPGAPLGIPIGANLETVPEKAHLMFKVAQVYEKHFGQPRMPIGYSGSSDLLSILSP